MTHDNTLLTSASNSKICTKCKVLKPYSAFGKGTRFSDGLQRQCRDCHNAAHLRYGAAYKARYPHARRDSSRKYRQSEHGREQSRAASREWYRRMREEQPEELYHRRRHTWLQKRYGITRTEYDALFQSQDGLCAICEQRETVHRGYLFVDHDHKTGRVRSLLCLNCNIALGCVRDNPSILQSLIQYIDHYSISEPTGGFQ